MSSNGNGRDDLAPVPVMGSAVVGNIHETSATAAAAHAKAMVEARFIVAMQRPRDYDRVRERLLRECKRFGFASQAEYSKPVGGSAPVRGASIRFAEAAIRAMGNVTVDTYVTYDDPEKRIVHVAVLDLETNADFGASVTIEKTVERKTPREGTEILGWRLNSYGKRVAIVRATEDEMLTKVNAAISKTIRTQGLRLVPGDLIEEALDLCAETVRAGDKGDPEAARKKLADAFADLGVSVVELKRYLGHELAQSSPAELANLRVVYATIRDGEATWTDILRDREDARAGTRDGAKLDDKDRKAIASLAAKRAASFQDESISQGVILRDLKLMEEDLDAMVKADLPKHLDRIMRWEPGGEKKDAEPEKAEAAEKDAPVQAELA